MILPNFFIVGAAKSGTTAIYHYIKQHPEIFMSPVKEPNFFALDGKQARFDGPGDNDYINSFSIHSLEKYKSLFDNATNAISVGEASPSYLYSPIAPKNIYKCIPQAKIIIILRNPVDRAYSQYRHFRRDSREPCSNFFKAFSLSRERLLNNWEWFWDYEGFGYYYSQVKRYYDLFDETNIKIYLYDDLKEDATLILKDLFGFLNVNQHFKPDTTTKHNVSNFVTYDRIQAFLEDPHHSLKRVLTPFLHKTLGINLTKRASRYIKEQYSARIKNQIRHKLIPLYKKDIKNLQYLIERDLSIWL